MIEIHNSTVTINVYAVLRDLPKELEEQLDPDFLDEIKRQAAVRYGVDHEQPANRS